MAKKGKGSKAGETTTGAAPVEDQETLDMKASENIEEEQKVQATSSAATPGETPEEQKVAGASEVKGAPIKRANSRITLQKGEDDQEKLFRPEFGKATKVGQEKLWDLMDSYIGTDQRSIQRSIVNHVEYTLARTRFNFDNFGAYQASAYSLRDRLIEAWNDTQQYHTVSEFASPKIDLLLNFDLLILTHYLCFNSDQRLQESLLFLAGVPHGPHDAEHAGQHRHGRPVQERSHGHWLQP